MSATAALNQLRRFEDALRLLDRAPPAVLASPETTFNRGVAAAAIGRVEIVEESAVRLERSNPDMARSLRAFAASVPSR